MLDLDFTISNLNREHAASTIAFTNDLDATLLSKDAWFRLRGWLGFRDSASA